ncbi:hypothetical protein C0993_008584 [Termitomyces sp. T159_Od127]|nr:hypothetical protein C0993_008584 [Termitomyces sp. T159_Od127]
MLTPTADAFLASTSFIARTNLLLVQVQGLSTEAPHNKVEGMMRLWQKWRTMRGSRIMWERDRELLEWCMARYRDNLGIEWLVPFANDFALPAPSFDEELEALLAEEELLVLWSDLSPHSKEAVIAPLVEQDLRQQEQFWQDVAKESKADVQQCITNSLEALAHEGLGLEEATGAGKGSWQGQEEEEEEEGAKETTPDTMAGAATGVATPVPRKAPTGGAKRLVLPAKKGSPTKPSTKRRGRPAPRYEAPTQEDFSNKELARLLAPRRVEAVVDTGVEVGVVLKETKRKAMVDLATRQAFKEERGANGKVPRVTGEAFEWLGEDLAHPVVPLQPAAFLERMRAQATQIERLLEQEREAVQAELMGLHLWYSMLRRSVEMLCNYQEDITQALEWQEENNIQEGDLLPLHDSSLPSDDD